jgi:hypothetical protein
VGLSGSGGSVLALLWYNRCIYWWYCVHVGLARTAIDTDTHLTTRPPDSVHFNVPESLVR